MSTYVKDVGVADFVRDVVERSHQVPVVVDFWAEWCAPCRTLGPMLEQAAEAAEGTFLLAKVDVDQNQALASQFGVQGIPTVLGFRNGQAVTRFVGAIPQTRLDAWLGELVPSEDDNAVEQARDLVLAGDEAGAEQVYRDVLEADSRHIEAGVGLATLLIGSQRSQEALHILETLPATPEVQSLRAAARIGVGASVDLDTIRATLADHPDDLDVRMELAGGLAARGEHQQALAELLTVVKAGPSLRDEARLRMLDLFQVLGADHPLTSRYRRELANALF